MRESQPSGEHIFHPLKIRLEHGIPLRFIGVVEKKSAAKKKRPTSKWMPTAIQSEQDEKFLYERNLQMTPDERWKANRNSVRLFSSLKPSNGKASHFSSSEWVRQSCKELPPSRGI